MILVFLAIDGMMDVLRKVSATKKMLAPPVEILRMKNKCKMIVNTS